MVLYMFSCLINLEGSILRENWWLILWLDDNEWLFSVICVKLIGKLWICIYWLLRWLFVLLFVLLFGLLWGWFIEIFGICCSDCVMFLLGNLFIFLVVIELRILFELCFVVMVFFKFNFMLLIVIILILLFLVFCVCVFFFVVIVFFIRESVIDKVIWFLVNFIILIFIVLSVLLLWMFKCLFSDI